MDGTHLTAENHLWVVHVDTPDNAELAIGYIYTLLDRDGNPEGSHFQAILHSLGTFALPTMPATAELGTRFWRIHPPNFCFLPTEDLTKCGG